MDLLPTRYERLPASLYGPQMQCLWITQHGEVVDQTAFRQDDAEIAFESEPDQDERGPLKLIQRMDARGLQIIKALSLGEAVLEQTVVTGGEIATQQLRYAAMHAQSQA